MNRVIKIDEDLTAAIIFVAMDRYAWLSFAIVVLNT